jgi:hypothetical protein
MCIQNLLQQTQTLLLLLILCLVVLRWIVKSVPEWAMILLIVLGALFFLKGPGMVGCVLMLVLMLWGIRIMVFGLKRSRR